LFQSWDILMEEIFKRPRRACRTDADRNFRTLADTEISQRGSSPRPRMDYVQVCGDDAGGGRRSAGTKYRAGEVGC
jgi:hypothetical protein